MTQRDNSYQEKLIFKYEGDLEYIDIDTLFVSQLHFAELIREVNSCIYPDSKLNIKVKALPPGSFPIELMLDQIEPAKDILDWGKGVLIGIGGFAGAIVSIFELIKFLKGEKPSNVIHKEKNNTTTVFKGKTKITVNTHIYNMVSENGKIKEEASKTVKPIGNDSNVDGLSLVDTDGETIFEMAKEDFNDFSQKRIDEAFSDEQESRVQSKKNVELIVFKIVFADNNRWSMYYDGFRISVEIADEAFLNQVTEGLLAFSAGDVLICDIDILQSKDKGSPVFRNSSYKVVKVHQLKHKKIQSNMFD